jgi:hypothetical protein
VPAWLLSDVLDLPLYGGVVQVSSSTVPTGKGGAGDIRHFASVQLGTIPMWTGILS